MERKTWRKGVSEPLQLEDARAHIHDFKAYYQELRMKQLGWFRADQEPPIREPPPSEDWVKDDA